MLNDCALDSQLVMELTRGQPSLDLTWCATHDLVRDVNVFELLRYSDHLAIRFAIHIGGREPGKFDVKTIAF